MAKGKLQSAKDRLKKAVAENKSLQKVGGAIKRANTEENRKMLMVGGVAAAAGAAAGYKAQEYLEGADAPVPMNVALIGDAVPLTTALGLGIAIYGAMKLKGQSQAAVAGFGGGMAGGGYVHQMSKG